MAEQNKNSKSKAKKIVITILVVVLSLGLLAIIGTVALGATIINGLFPNISLNSQAEKNFEYLKNHKTEKLIKQFSKNAQNYHDLEQEFEDFYTSIDGDLIGYDKAKCTDYEKYVDAGKTTKHAFTCEYENAQTSTGKVYESLSYNLYKTNDYYPDAVGINTLTIRDEGERAVVGLRGEDFDNIRH